MIRLLAGLALVALVLYTCDLFTGLPPDLTGVLAAFILVVLVGAVTFALGRWSRG